MHEAFVYCWTDKATNKLYIGSHKGLEEDGYICSSKLMLEEFKKRPQDFSRQIIGYGDWNEIRVFERKILQAANAANQDDYYNQHNADSKFYYITPVGKGPNRNKKLSKEWKENLSKSLKGKKKPKGFSEKCRKNRLGKPSPTLGKSWKWSEESKQKISGDNNVSKRADVRQKISNSKKKK